MPAGDTKKCIPVESIDSIIAFGTLKFNSRLCISYPKIKFLCIYSALVGIMGAHLCRQSVTIPEVF